MCSYELTIAYVEVCKGVVMWKALRHLNILLLIGVTMSDTQLAIVSEWMANGNIDQFMEACPHVDRLGLVRSLFGARLTIA